MNELMKRYEKETGKSSTTIWRGECNVSNNYIEWLEAKATAYDSLVSKTIISDAELDAPLAQKILREMCEKAEAYDRVMSGGKKTLKEWANIFGLPFALGRYSQGIAFKCKNLPVVAGNNWWPTDVGDFGFAFIDRSLIDFSGNWEDSLTLPDEWEKSK